MTPEAAHEIGKRVSRELAAELAAPPFDGSADGLLHVIEFSLEQEIDRPAVVPALRGASEFWLEFALDLEARAAALESTR